MKKIKEAAQILGSGLAVVLAIPTIFLLAAVSAAADDSYGAGK